MTPDAVDGTRIRTAARDDAAFLTAMVGVAVAWRPSSVPPSVAAILADPHLAHYVVGWPGPDDVGLIAEDRGGRPIGAAWWRFLPDEDPGFGFVAPDVPELSIGVVERWRGRGVGTALLSSLLARADAVGIARVSLSVEPDNPARRLYERLGFVAPGATGAGRDGGDPGAGVTLVRSNPRTTGGG